MSAYIGKKPVDVLNYDHWTDTAKYTLRNTADGLEIIDGRLAQVKKIQGDTVRTESGLKHAYFDSIKSTGRNIFNPKVASIWKTYDCEIESQSKTEIVLVNTKNTQYQQVAFPVSIQKEIIGKTIQFSGEWECTGENNTRISVGWLNFRQDGSMLSLSPLYSTPHSNKTSEPVFGYSAYIIDPPPAEAYNSVFVVSIYSNLNGVGEVGSKAILKNINVTIGGNRIQFEPYKESAFDFPLSIELKKWDYILPQAQKIVRKTKTVTNPTPFTDEEISQYPNAIVALDKLSLIYEGEETVTELDMPKGYTAWRGGTETVIQGTNDNSAYGAMPTIQTAYENRVYRGVIQCQSKENKRE